MLVYYHTQLDMTYITVYRMKKHQSAHTGRFIRGSKKRKIHVINQNIYNGKTNVTVYLEYLKYCSYLETTGLG
jgi:hypothetical protein